MKKIISSLLFSVLILSGAAVSAQFEKGDKLLNAGINLGGTYGGGGVGLGASFEAGVHDFISVGGQADFVSWNYGWIGSDFRYNFFTVAARGSYHFGKHFLTMDNLDLYAGPSLGYRISKYKTPGGWSGIYSDSYGSGVFFGVFAEVGYNASPLKAGITFKF